jgi:hypothetical protein
MGGSTLVVQDHNGILVQNLSTGKETTITDRNTIIRVQTDGEKVAYNWLPRWDQQDPLTVYDLRRDTEDVYEPNNAILTFNMVDGKILYLRSTVPLNPDDPDTDTATALLVSSLVFLVFSILLFTACFVRHERLRPKRAPYQWYNYGPSYQVPYYAYPWPQQYYQAPYHYQTYHSWPRY